MRTSYKKNRPFDFKLIDLVEPNTVLYQRNTGLSNYDLMKAKNKIWDHIAEEMGRDVQFCLMRWNNLRYQFQKELRRTMELCPKLGVIRGSTWPYLDRLRFLENLPLNKPKKYSKKTNCSNRNESRDILWETSSEISENELVNGMPEERETIERKVLNQRKECNESEYTIIEEITENNTDEIIEEEIVFHEMENNITEDVDEIKKIKSANVVTKTLIESNMSNTHKMDVLLSNIHEGNRPQVEKRIYAFLLKCQLRTLVNETVDDLNI